LKKRRKEGRGRAGKRKGAQPRSAATTSGDRALQESEAKFRSLVENTAAPIGITNLTGDFTYVNKALADLTGYTVQELEGRPFMQFLHPEDRERVLGIFTKGASTSGEAPEIEFRVTRRDGQMLTLTSKPTRFEIDRKTVGFQAIITDITERKKADEALKESEERYRLLIERQKDGLCIVDLEERFVFCNPAGEEIFGVPRGGLVGRNVREFTTPETFELIRKQTEKRRSGESSSYEIEITSPNGERRQLLTTAAPWLDKDGRIVGALAIFRDETDRKRAEEALRRRAEELAALQATVLDITGSHDLPILLQTIVERAARLVGAPAGGMYLCDPEKQQARCVVSYNTPHDYVGTALKYGEGAAGIVAKTGIPLVVDDYRTWQGRAGVFEEERPFRAVLTVPMIWQGRMTGVIDVLDDTASRRFTQADQELLTLFANHAAIAVESTRLLDQEKRHAKELTRYSTNLEQLVAERTGKLRESEDRFRGIAERSLDGIFELDLEGRVTYVSPSVESALGYKPEEVVGTRMERYLAESEIPKIAPNMAALMEGTNVVGLQGEMLRKDGTHVSAELNASPIFRDGKIVGVQGIVRDITERRNMEDALRISERRFRDLADLLPQIVFEIAANGNLQFMNRAAFVATGCTEEDFRRGLNAFHMFASEDHDRAKQGIRRTMTGETIGGREFTVLRRDGTSFPALVYTAPIMREGKAVGLRGIAIDITERKRTEEELRAARERLEYVVTSNPAVICSGKPLADYSDWYLTYISESVVALLGFEPREFIGHPEFWDHHVPPEDVRFVRAGIPLLWKKGQHAVEYRFLHRNGTYRWVREEAKVVRDAQGKPIEVNGYWTDVTERKRMEARLAESQRLAVIGETTAMVGHDLRNPLQAIVSTVYLAKRRLESPLESSKKPAVKPGLVEMLETIEDEAEYMNKIVSDLQDYAAPLKTEPKPVEMKPLVKDTLSKIRITRNVKVSFKVSEPLPMVMIDPAVMRRVFTNLITNAIQAMPDGGELEIDMYGTDELLFVAFKDTGIGIPEENMGKLFNPFFTTKAKGQGLGLPVCKKLVEAHNGRITVESKPGEGSTFTVKLPLVKP